MKTFNSAPRMVKGKDTGCISCSNSYGFNVIHGKGNDLVFKELNVFRIQEIYKYQYLLLMNR